MHKHVHNAWLDGRLDVGLDVVVVGCSLKHLVGLPWRVPRRCKRWCLQLRGEMKTSPLHVCTLHEALCGLAEVGVVLKTTLGRVGPELEDAVFLLRRVVLVDNLRDVLDGLVDFPREGNGHG